MNKPLRQQLQERWIIRMIIWAELLVALMS
jgi:hypothetical protein